MVDAFDEYALEAKDKAVVKLLKEMNEKLARIVELLESQGRIRPS